MGLRAPHRPEVDRELPFAEPAVRRLRRAPWFRPRESISSRRYAIVAIVGSLTPVAMWAAVTYGGLVDPLFLPTPSGIAISLKEWYEEGTLVRDILASSYVVYVGFACAAALAVPLGLLMGSLRVVEAALEPSTAFIRYLPVTALIPLSILMLGIGNGFKIAIIFVGTYFQLVLMIAAVSQNVLKELLETAYTLGVGRRMVFLRVLAPAALPGMMDSLRITLGWSWTYLVSAELVASDKGLGFEILQSLRGLQTERIYAGILVIGMLGLASDALFRYMHTRLLPWSERARN